jgi:SET domain-containing protein
MRLGIFAATKIKKGQEITYDYAFQYDCSECVVQKKARETKALA